MKAMILAAGLGQRMRPLTDNLPKPLLSVGGKPLLQYHLEALAALRIKEVIINIAYLGDKICEFASNGSQFGLKIHYSQETEPLETAGGILQALPLIGNEPILLINGDVWSDYPLARLHSHQLRADENAHLVLVPNPDFHPNGDFAPNSQGLLVTDKDLEKFTFAGISLIHPRMIGQYPLRRRKFPLGEVLRDGIEKGQITAEIYRGRWSDVGTPERLHTLDEELQKLPGRA